MSSTFLPANSLSFQLPENITFSKNPDQFYNQFTNLYYQIAKSSNNKDIGSYETTELVNGQRYFGANPQTKRTIYRKVVECGALPNATTTTTAHGISGIGTGWMFTRIYGSARNVTPQFIPIPNAGATYPVEIMVDATNINITSTVDLSGFTYSLIILEYYKI